MFPTEQKTVIWVIIGLNSLGNTLVMTYQRRETAEADLQHKRNAHPEIMYRMVKVDFD